MNILNGWKEVASYLGRGVRTVQRWEELGLPVRRPKGADRSAVIAIPEEIDAWLRNCKTHRGNSQASRAAAEQFAAAEVLCTRAEQTRELLERLRFNRAAMRVATAEVRNQLAEVRSRFVNKRTATMAAVMPGAGDLRKSAAS